MLFCIMAELCGAFVRHQRNLLCQPRRVNGFNRQTRQPFGQAQPDVYKRQGHNRADEKADSDDADYVKEMDCSAFESSPFPYAFFCLRMV